MLKLTLKPGEYIDIGKDIRVVFSGGSANNIHLLVDAPRELDIARSNSTTYKKKNQYFAEKPISKEAQKAPSLRPITTGVLPCLSLAA